MRIAIASYKNDVASQVAEQAGRAPFYLIFDDGETPAEAVKNPFSVGGGGAGYGVAKMLADKSVDTVVAGKFGGNMIGALDQRGLSYRETGGTVAEALRDARGNRS
jgi:predicted Fe-Mo cluster-binding NifX family protein